MVQVPLLSIEQTIYKARHQELFFSINKIFFNAVLNHGQGGHQGSTGDELNGALIHQISVVCHI